MKLSIALTASLANVNVAEENQYLGQSVCNPDKNCILNLTKIFLDFKTGFVEKGNQRVSSQKEEDDFCSMYGMTTFSWLRGRILREFDTFGQFYPICYTSDQTDYSVNWKQIPVTGCFHDISKCGSPHAKCCSAYHDQNTNIECSLGAQRAARQSYELPHHTGHFCVVPDRSPVESPVVPSVDQSDESNGLKRLNYSCGGFSQCLPNPFTFQPEGNIACTVTYNDRTMALKDCLASNCSHLLEYEFKGTTHYELLNEDHHEGCRVSSSNKRFQNAEIKPRAAYRTVRRQRRSTNDPVKVSTTWDIIGHSENPFQQRKNFYPELNLTDIIVEAHNEYGENRFLIDHESDLRVGVINNSCVISPESANNWRNYHAVNENNPAMANTLKVSLKSSYKDSEHSLDMFPAVIQDACKNKKLLDLEYIAQSDDEVFNLPINNLVEFPETSKRIRRAVTMNGKKLCPVRYCEEKQNSGECRQGDYAVDSSENYPWEWHTFNSPITTACTTQRGFGDTCEYNGVVESIPNCWYDLGTISAQGGWGEKKRRKVPVFVHLVSDHMFCMPCCASKPIRDLTMNDIAYRTHWNYEQRAQYVREANENKNKMPICDAITLRSSMCHHLISKGRCGEDFPTSHQQYMFIKDDVITPSSVQAEKDACLSKAPSPLEEVYDYY